MHTLLQHVTCTEMAPKINGVALTCPTLHFSIPFLRVQFKIPGIICTCLIFFTGAPESSETELFAMD